MSVSYRIMQEKGICVLDIPSDIVPRSFLDSLLKSFNTNFKFFFDEFVIEANRNILRDEILSKRCGGDVCKYRELVSLLLASIEDKRAINAVAKELKMLEKCKMKNICRVPFMGINSRKKRIYNDGSPIRVFLCVHDKIDIRIGAALLGISLSQYIGELITDGMLKMFIRGSTTPEERFILYRWNENPEIPQECVEIIYERIIHEYRTALSSTYGNTPQMKYDFSFSGLDRIIKGINIDGLHKHPKFSVAMDIFDLPPKSLKTSIIDDNDSVDMVSISKDVIDCIMLSNRERILKKPLIEDRITNPMIKAAIDRFRDVVAKRYVMKETRIAEIWKETKLLIRHQIESLSSINGVNIENVNMDSILGEISKSMTFILMSHGILDGSANNCLDLEQDLIKRIRDVIDDSTNDGGITKTELRNKIGRNHLKYLPMIDEILAYLLESGKYSFQNGKFIANSSGYGSRMVPCAHRGRPPKNEGREIIRMVEGKLSDYVPIPNRSE